MKSKHGRKRKTVSPTSARLKHASMHPAKPRSKPKSHRPARVSDPLPRSSQPLHAVSPARARKSLPTFAAAAASTSTKPRRSKKDKDKERDKKKRKKAKAQLEGKSPASLDKDKAGKRHRKGAGDGDVDDPASAESASSDDSGSSQSGSSGSSDDSDSDNSRSSGDDSEGSSSDSDSSSSEESDDTARPLSPVRQGRAQDDGGASKAIRKFKKSAILTHFDLDATAMALSYDKCRKDAKQLFVDILGKEMGSNMLNCVRDLETCMEAGVAEYDRAKQALETDVLKSNQLKAEQELASLEDATRRVLANRLNASNEMQAAGTFLPLFPSTLSLLPFPTPLAESRANIEGFRKKFEAGCENVRTEIKAAGRKSK
ncbi:hypothetical protein RQP46_004840 [Phenoliferia psychrophenolica]